MKTTRKIGTKYALWGLVFIGTGLRFFHLGSQSLNWDELDTIMMTGKSYVGIIQELFGRLSRWGHPPLYYLVAKAGTVLGGTSEFALRFPSMLFSTLSILAMYFLGKELFNKKVGLFSAVFVTFSVHLVSYAQYAKPYALFWFLVTFQFLFFLRSLKFTSRLNFVFYVLSTLFCVYTLYTGFVLILVQAIYVMIACPRRFKWFGWAMGIVALLYLPWGFVLYKTATLHEAILWMPKTDNYFLFFVMVFQYLTGVFFGNNVPFEWAGFLVVLCLGVFYTPKEMGQISVERMNKSDLLLYLWIFVPIILYILVDAFITPVLTVRYVGFLYIPFYILLGKGISCCGNKASIIILCVFVGISLTQHIFPYYERNLTPGGHDTRGVLIKIKSEAPLALVVSKMPLSFYTQKVGLDFVKMRQLPEVKKKYDKIFIVYQCCDNLDSLSKAGEVPPDVPGFLKRASKIFGKNFKLTKDYKEPGIGFLEFDVVSVH